jgi:hypothetical protein
VLVENSRLFHRRANGSAAAILISTSDAIIVTSLDDRVPANPPPMVPWRNASGWYNAAGHCPD